MKISAINFNFRNSKNINKIPFQNKNAQENTQENSSFQGANYLSNLNSLFLASNISFGNNVKIIEQMKKEKNVEKRKELFKDLTQKAQDNVIGVVEHEKFKDLKDKNGKPILTFENYIQACIKHPSLLYQLPDATINKVLSVVRYEKFGGLKDKNGDPILTLEKYLLACIKKPSLFCQSPDTVTSNVVGVVEHEKLKNENGEPILTLEEYLPVCIKQPQLFCQSPETLIRNVVNVVEHEKFKNLKDENGKPVFTLENYIPGCIKQTSLFCQTSDRIVNNIIKVVEHEKLKDENGKPILTVKEYLPVCIKQPQLFCQSPDTVADHIKTLLFINKDRLYFKTGEINRDTLVENVLKNTLLLTCTNDLNYSFLLREKMFPNRNPKGIGGNGKIGAKLKQYLENNPNEKFTFSIIKDEKSKEFIEFAKRLAKEATGRDDVFNVNCVEMV